MKLLKIGEAAKLMGIPMSTLRQWHNNGQFVADVVYPGCGYRFYDAERVLAYKEQFKVFRKGEHKVKHTHTQELGL